MAYTEQPLHIGVVSVSKPAASDLSTKQYYFVDVNSAGNVELAGAGERLLPRRAVTRPSDAP